MKRLYSQSWPLSLNRGEWRNPGICLNLRALAEANVCDVKSTTYRMLAGIVLAIEYVSVCLPHTLLNIQKVSPL